MLFHFVVEFKPSHRVVRGSRLPEKITAYLVSIGQLLCLAFLYRWRFLYKISLDWPLTLTTQLSTSKLSDNLESPGTLIAKWEHYIVLNCSVLVNKYIILVLMLITWLVSYCEQCDNLTLVKQAAFSWPTNCQVCRSEKNKNKNKKGYLDTLVLYGTLPYS